MHYHDITKYFGRKLEDSEFAMFLKDNFTDLTDYDIFSGYIIGEDSGLEFGFVNEDAVFDDDTLEIINTGTPVFSHINILPTCKILTVFPFDIDLSELRTNNLKKTGEPYRTVRTEIPSFDNSIFFNDHFQQNDLAISLDYDPETERIRNIQIRDLTLIPDEFTSD